MASYRHLPLQLSLQLLDSPARCRQLGPLRGRHARLKAPVDPVLARPAEDRLVADLQVPCDVDDLATGRDQIEHLAPELSRITTSSHNPSRG